MTENREPEVTALFTLGGDFKPDELTNALGIRPTNVWKQKRPELLDRADLNRVEWSVGVEKIVSDNIDAVVVRALESIWERRSRVNEVARDMRLRASLACNVTFWGERPEYVLSSETMAKLAELGAEFCLDIFDYSED